MGRNALPLEFDSNTLIGVVNILDTFGVPLLKCPFNNTCGPKSKSAVWGEYDDEARKRIPTCSTFLHYFSSCYKDQKRQKP